MPVINSIAGFADEMRGWRHHLHQHPELGLDCHKTAEYVVDRLREFGITEIHTGIDQSGVVAIIEGKGAGPTIGLRADMDDALPMTETSGVDWASKTPGHMHACGHDGIPQCCLGPRNTLLKRKIFQVVWP